MSALCRLLLAFLLTPIGSAASATPSAVPADSIDYDRVADLGYAEHVQPLLADRDVFGFGDPDAYAWDALFASAAGATIVPFDGAGSLFVRLVRDLPDSVAIPYPNLRSLEPDEFRYLARWIEAGARDDAGTVPYADAETLLFACVQGENHVAVIDPARRRVIRRIYLDDLGLPSAPYGPHHIVFEPDGSGWYVSLISAGTVAKLSMDLSLDPSDPSYLLAASEPGGFVTPGMMALDAEAQRLYVGRSTLSSAGTYGLGAFDTQTMTLAE